MLATKESRAEITPLVRHDFTVPGSAVRFTAACFGGADTEWSLKPLQVPQDVAKNPVLVSKIRNAMRHLGADKLFAPYPAEFNAEIIHPIDLTKVLVLSHGVVLFRNAARPADGTLLRAPGDAGIFSAAGCSVIVASINEHLLFAHAGRDCVINRKRVLGESGARRNESVVDSMVDAFIDLGYSKEDLQRMHVWVLYSIKPEHFVHLYEDPNHAAYNLVVGAYLAQRGLSEGTGNIPGGVALDVPTIVQGQFLQYGVPDEHIHLEHCYLSDELPTTRRGGGRYLVAIVRK